MKFKVNRLQNKTEKLLENIPKLRKANRKPDGSIETYDKKGNNYFHEIY